jgi:hypothetical protein
MTAIASPMTCSPSHLTNSDAELERRIANFLYQRHVPGKERIRLVAYQGVVAVSGQIPTRSAKWLCMECCRRVAGVLRVIDNVEIKPAVNERPMPVAIRGKNENLQKCQSDKTNACGDQPSIPFIVRRDWKRRNSAASNRPKLRAVA